MFTAVTQGADVKQVSAFPIQHVPLSLIIQTSQWVQKIVDFLRDIPTVLSEYTCIS